MKNYATIRLHVEHTCFLPSWVVWFHFNGRPDINLHCVATSMWKGKTDDLDQSNLMMQIQSISRSNSRGKKRGKASRLTHNLEAKHKRSLPPYAIGWSYPQQPNIARWRLCSFFPVDRHSGSSDIFPPSHHPTAAMRNTAPRRVPNSAQ